MLVIKKWGDNASGSDVVRDVIMAKSQVSDYVRHFYVSTNIVIIITIISTFVPVMTLRQAVVSHANNTARVSGEV